MDFLKETSEDLDLPLNIRIPQDCSQEWVTLIRKSLKKEGIFSMQMRMTISFCSLTTQDRYSETLSTERISNILLIPRLPNKITMNYRYRKGYKRHLKITLLCYRKSLFKTAKRRKYWEFLTQKMSLEKSILW